MSVARGSIGRRLIGNCGQHFYALVSPNLVIPGFRQLSAGTQWKAIPELDLNRDLEAEFDILHHHHGLEALDVR